MVLALAFACISAVRGQTTVYWDTNKTANGSGKNLFDWDPSTSANWTTTAAGTAVTNTWASFATGANSIANFSATPVAIGSDGIFTVTTSGSIGNVGGITFNVGTVTIGGTGTLNLSQNAVITTTAAGTSTISAAIAGGFTLTKAGANTLLLSGSNTYTGLTTVGTGTLIAQNNTALGTTGGGTTVTSGASLSLRGNIAIGAEALTLNGTGVSANGALRNLDGNNTYGGPISLGALGATIGSNAGTLNLTGGISGATRTVRFVGNGSIVESGIIGTTSGGVTLNSANVVVTLSGNNTYTGATTITLGTLKLGASGGATNTPLGTVGTGTTVAAGGALDLNGFSLGTIEALNIRGPGIANTGSLTNSGGSASWQGTLALGAAATLGGTGNILVTGVVSGNFVLTKEGTNTVTFTAANSSTSTATLNHGTLSLAGVAGAMNAINKAGVTINPGGAFTLDNSVNNLAARYKDTAALNANGGTFNFLINSASGSYSETLGALNLNSGGLTFNTTQAASGQTSAITFASLARTAGGTVLFFDSNTTAGQGLGTSTRDRVVFTAAPTLTGNILPYGVISPDNGATYSFATYNATGTTSIKAYGYGGVGDTGGVGTWVAGTNARPTASVTIPGAGTTTINSLTLDSNFGLAAPAANNILALTSGGVLKTGSGTVSTITSGASNTTLAFGAVEAIFHVAPGATLVDHTNITGTAGLTKAGNGTLTLTAANAGLSGAVTLNAGTLRAQTNANALGTVSGGLTLNGGTLELAANTATAFNHNTTVKGDVTVKSDVVSGSTGVTQTLGTLTLGTAANSSVNLTIDRGALATGGAPAITFGTTTLTGSGATFTVNSGATLNLGAVTGATFGFSVGGAGNTSITGTIGTTSGTLTKTGSGTLSLSGANTFTGATTITDGIVEVSHAAAFGTSATNTVTVASGAQLSLNAAGLVLGSNNTTVTLAGTGPSGSALVNGYTTAGGTTVQLKNNIVLSADTTVSSGTASGNILQLGLASSYVPGVSAGGNSTLDLGPNTLTFTGAAGTKTQTKTNMIGTGGVNIDTAGTVEFYDPRNTYTGTTTVTNGTLLVNSANNPLAPHDGTYQWFYSINGPLVIGDIAGAGGLLSATVTLGDGVAAGTVNEPISPTAPVTIYSDGYLKLMGNAQTVGPLTMTGGKIDGSTGSLWLDYANTPVVIAPTATSGSSIIEGKLNLTFHKDAIIDGTVTQQRIFNVGYNAANSTGSPTNGNGDLYITAVVDDGSIVKTGAGTMTLAPNYGGTFVNQYLGNTTVSNGILNVRAGTIGTKSALGESTGVGQDTIVNGGTLQLQGNIAITTEALTLFGNGYAGTQGALENLSGNNTWGTTGGGPAGGAIQLGANARIGSVAGLLTIPTNLSSVGGGNFSLTVGGDGNTTISGSINTGSGPTTSLTKVGNGTLTLSGNNAYQGLTDIQTGIVVAAHNNALGATNAGTTVAGGAELQLTNTITIPNETLTISGTGYNSGATGALRNFSGSNTFGGAITVGSPSARINSDTGLLTLTGGISTGGNAFVVGGVGNTTATGTVGGAGALTKDGAGTATFSNLTGLGNVTVDAGTLTFSGASLTGSTVTLNAGTLNFNGATATVGQVHLLGGAGSVINVGSSTTLTTNEFNSDALSTLSIAGGGTVLAHYGTGTTTTFSGQLAGTGTFKALGAGTVIFDQTSVSAAGLTVYLGGTSVGTNAAPLTFSITHNAHLTFNNLYITGDTILDFGNSSASFLTSANLYIAANVLITVQNWISMVDAWFVTGSSPGFSGSILDRTGSTPENQITFTGFTNNSTAWINQSTYGSFQQNEIRPVPELATYGALLASGCFGLIAFRHYRRHRLTGRAA